MRVTPRDALAMLLIVLTGACSVVSHDLVAEGKDVAGWMTSLLAMTIFSVAALIALSDSFWHWLLTIMLVAAALAIIATGICCLALGVGYELPFTVAVPEYGKPLFLGAGVLCLAASMPILHHLWSRACSHHAA